jgi:hypothetical protein
MFDSPTAKIVNGVKLVGEILLLPGTSLLLDGKVKPGLLHAGAGVLARLVLGFPGLAVVAANSYSLSLTGKNLFSVLFRSEGREAGSLVEQVRRKLASGFSLKEIQESISEDIEDIYVEASFARVSSRFRDMVSFRKSKPLIWLQKCPEFKRADAPVGQM